MAIKAYTQSDVVVSWIWSGRQWLPVNDKYWVWSETHREWQPQEDEQWAYDQTERMWVPR